MAPRAPSRRDFEVEYCYQAKPGRCERSYSVHKATGERQNCTFDVKLGGDIRQPQPEPRDVVVVAQAEALAFAPVDAEEGALGGGDGKGRIDFSRHHCRRARGHGTRRDVFQLRSSFVHAKIRRRHFRLLRNREREAL